MIIPLSLIGLLAIACVALLASPYPFLAPGAVIGLAGLLALYKRPAWGLLAIITLVPLEGLFKDSELTASKMIGAALALVLVLQLAVKQLPAERLRSSMWRLLLGFMALYLLSFWASDSSEMSLGHFRELAVGLLLFGITLLVGRDLDLPMMYRLVTLSVSLTCIMAMASAKYQDEGRAAGLLEDPNVFAMLIAIAVPMALWLVFNSPRRLHKLFWIACCILLLAGMTKTNSRSGLVVLLISLGIVLVHYRTQVAHLRPRHLGFAMLGLAILLPTMVALMPASYVARIQSLALLKSGVNAFQDDSLGRRSSYIVVGSKMIREHPVLGTGPGTFPLHYATTGYAKAFSANRKVGDLYRRAHNTYLEIFSEVGIPAGILFVSMVLLALYNVWYARRLWLRQGEQGQADLLTHLCMSMLAISLFLMFLSAPNHKYLWIMLALSSVLRLKAEQAQPAQVKA
ncbi:O-antigen ligase family protein [Pseudomonas sp. BIGb0427]|uniref:O-antigen ligase family protein n=1 Tax=unclassified Pseudomonas TaxID=196821 RepID=UPI00088B399E|nr:MULTISPECIES: O-antigen ligase family protein [unclassified Pseudomonas]QPG61741.1 O-antigen ligase family protein [Pseudomonas sp. BIGb0427]QVM94438.1 O-antigen ligase family protein [Pseudomonas sp. SORT22]UVL58704.1 O-antigen ligase family protein [Pseudomonas sp. B21-035]SDQ73348.1 O-antigen ligase [Pseudomonas sp. UC 17F4]